MDGFFKKYIKQYQFYYKMHNILTMKVNELNFILPDNL